MPPSRAKQPVPGDPFRRIVWPIAVAETLCWAAMFYSFPVLLITFEQDTGWSRGELSLSFTQALLASALLAPLAGRLIDRGHARRVFMGSAALGAVLLVALSQVNALWQFKLLWLGIGAAMAGSLYEACFAVLTHALGTQARKAITRVALVAGFASTVSYPISRLLADAVGWRGTVALLGMSIVVIALPLIWYATGIARHQAREHAHKSSSRLRHALPVMRKSAFWLLAAAFAAIALSHGMLITHIFPILANRGASEASALLAASMIGPMQVTGRLVAMAVERHATPMAMIAGCYISMALGALALYYAGVASGLLFMFVLLHGAGNGVLSILRPVVIAHLLGRRDFGTVAGMLAIPFLATTAFAPSIAAWIWSTATYDAVIALALIATCLGLASILAAGKVGETNRL